MIIDDYQFGQITISGQQFSKDVIILPDRVISPWRRQNGHTLIPADLEEIMEAEPEVILVGTGKSGLMKVPPETIEYFAGKGIEVFSYPTADAVNLYNNTPKCHIVVAALHITC